MSNVNITAKPETQESNNLLMNLLVLSEQQSCLKIITTVFLSLEQIWPTKLSFSLSAVFKHGREQIKTIKCGIAQLKILMRLHTSV